MALPDLATACHGYSGADLAALCREAAMSALSDAAAAMLAGAALANSSLFSTLGGRGRGLGGKGTGSLECYAAVVMLASNASN